VVMEVGAETKYGGRGDAYSYCDINYLSLLVKRRMLPVQICIRLCNIFMQLHNIWRNIRFRSYTTNGQIPSIARQ
jgi:hypothetical protein